MKLRWRLTIAFLMLAALLLAVVIPIAHQRLSTLLHRQQTARIDQLMVAANALVLRMQDAVTHAIDEISRGQEIENFMWASADETSFNRLAPLAAALMRPHDLDVLAIMDESGRTLSSGHLPARFQEPDDPLFEATRRPERSLSKLRVLVSHEGDLYEVPTLVAARAVEVERQRLWIVGGVQLSEPHAVALSRLCGASVEIVDSGSVIASFGLKPEGEAIVRSIPVDDETQFVFRFSDADAIATQREVFVSWVLLAIVSFALTTTAGWIYSTRISRPVEALTDAVRRVGAGASIAPIAVPEGTADFQELISAFNRMTSDLNEATSRLVASERAAAWNEVARHVAHEIKNPLTPIKMSLETLLAASKRPELSVNFMRLFESAARTILEEVERMTRIVDAFSAFAKLPQPIFSDVDLGELVASALKLYTADNTVTVSINCQPQIIVRADRDQLNALLLNVVKNAVEAMTPLENRQLRIRVFRENSRAVVDVEDSGPGIASHVREKIFEPYATTKPHGTGLGLAISTRIANEHHGQLEFMDAKPHGTRFRFSMPLVEAITL